LARVRLRLDPNDKCFSTYWVLRKQPFLNRHHLRPLLKEFIQSSDRALLKISGPGAGRSYTIELLDYLRSQIDDLHFVPITLNQRDGPTYKVQALAAEFLDPMGEVVPQTSSSNEGAELSRCVLRELKKRTGVWVFVLDGFSQDDLHPDIKDFIGILARKCTTPEYRRSIRLVLVNYTATFENVLPAAIASEEIPLPTVDRRDLIDCLTQLNELRLEAGLPQLAGLATIADAMLAGAPSAADPRTQEKMRLQYLYDSLCAVAKMGGADGR
jgi:hypothetical protein